MRAYAKKGVALAYAKSSVGVPFVSSTKGWLIQIPPFFLQVITVWFDSGRSFSESRKGVYAGRKDACILIKYIHK